MHWIWVHTFGRWCTVKRVKPSPLHIVIGWEARLKQSLKKNENYTHTHTDTIINATERVEITKNLASINFCLAKSGKDYNFIPSLLSCLCFCFRETASVAGPTNINDGLADVTISYTSNVSPLWILGRNFLSLSLWARITCAAPKSVQIIVQVVIFDDWTYWAKEEEKKKRTE